MTPSDNEVVVELRELKGEFRLWRQSEEETHERLDRELAVLALAVKEFNALIRSVLVWAVLGLLGIVGGMGVYIIYLLFERTP